MTDARLHAGDSTRPNPTRSARWIVLVAMSVCVYGSYYAFDYIGSSWV